MPSALIIDAPGVCEDSAGQLTLSDAARSWLIRVSDTGVRLLLLRSKHPEALAAAVGGAVAWSVCPGSGPALPSLREFALTLQASGAAVEQSWLISADAQALSLAAAVGCVGSVLIGADAPPRGIACVVAQARDLADAPRVMIPPRGGCWHDLRVAD